MLCISVTPTSRTLAKVDLLNAASQGDIVELGLDNLVKEPDFKELLSVTSRPIIISCRRPQEGGHWKGTDEQRISLLRQAIVAGPAYIELDLETAPSIPRFGNVQRVISFTRLDRPEHDIDGIFDEAAQANADVVKFHWPTPTIDDAWPLLAAVSQKKRLPIVGMGVGRPELTFSLLGTKYGSPWVYAALEKGMEAHEGQATVFELTGIYHIRDIDRQTKFVAVAGFDEAATISTRIFNAAFQQQGLNVRCLPIQIGDLQRVRKMLDVLKIRAILVFGQTGVEILPLAEHVDKVDFQTQYLDLLLRRDDGWHGYNSIWRSAVQALEAGLGKTQAGQRPLEKHNVMVLGTGGVARAMVYALAERKGIVTISGPDDKQAKKIAELMGCRCVPFHNMYDTLVDVLVIADPALKCGTSHGSINPSLLRPSMMVVDVSNPPLVHPLLNEATERGCRTVAPRTIYEHQAVAQYKVIAGKDLPRDVLASVLG
jgi:3-dehydroquinate dehydratase / shikimate dehydrogenase